MNTAIIGIGAIGSRLATRFVEHEVPVTVAASTLERAQDFAAQLGELATPASVEDAIANNEAIIFAVPFDTLLEFATRYRDALAGKIVIDPSNAIAFTAEGEAYSLNPEGVSAAERILAALGDSARYVKAFGTMAAEAFEKTEADNGGRTVILYATEDEEAGRAVAALAERGGWDALAVGGVASAGRIEVFGDLHPFGGLAGEALNKEEYAALL